MSATGRSDVREPNDFYATPAWCVDRLLDRLWFPCDRGWLEPAAGHGAVNLAVDAWRARKGLKRVGWKQYELQSEFNDVLREQGHQRCVGISFLDFAFTNKWPIYDVVITNPPYSLAQEFVERCLPLAYNVVMLLRLGFLATEKRSQLMREHPPAVYVLPNRPSFTGGGTDASDYAWFVWGESGNAGRFEILSSTSSENRKPAVKGCASP